MKHNEVYVKQGSTILLRAAILALGLAVLALCVTLLPAINREWTSTYPDVAQLRYPVLIGLIVTALAFFGVLYQGMKLLGYIDGNKAFSQISVKALSRIKINALTISGLYAVALPLIYYVAQKEDAPGLMVIGLLFCGAPFAAAVFAALLQKLLQNAIDIKSENDLTV